MISSVLGIRSKSDFEMKNCADIELCRLNKA